MTKRMLSNSISLSLQVNKLPLPAQLLFTWIICHADCDGRLKGDPEYIKATVVPLKKWAIKRIKEYLELMHQLNLIYYWEQNNEWFIEFVKWNEYQYIPKDRYRPSTLPTNPYKNVTRVSTDRIQTVNKLYTQTNINEGNLKKDNTSEIKESQIVSDFNRIKKVFSDNPKYFSPTNESETAAQEVWKKLEPDNPTAFFTTYLTAARKGFPAQKFYEFCSEILQDSNIKNRGAIFNKKVEDYLSNKAKT